MIYNKSGVSIDEAYDLNGNNLSYAYDKDGNEIWAASSDLYNYADYTISEDLISITSGNYYEGMAEHNGIICHVIAEDKLKLIDLATGNIIVDSMALDTAHGNTAVFTDDYYDENDEFPLMLSSSSYTTVNLNRITRNGTTLIKKLKMTSTDGGGYKLGYCYDKETRRIYTLGYTSSNVYHDTSSTNKIIIGCWDYDDLTSNEDGTYTPALISTARRNFLECFQGCDFFNGYIWTSVGITNNISNYLYAIDPTTAEIKYTYSLPVGEPEGVSWVNNDYLLFGRNIGGSGMYYAKITFESL